MNNKLRGFNILVTGANGQLGRTIKQLVINQKNVFKKNNLTFYFTTKNQVDITNKKKIEEFVKTYDINIIVNCAAYTAVDKAETEFKIADTINHLAVQYLAEISKERDISLIHISTDYVFDGKNYKPYIETDLTNPKNIYGKTKLAGEKAIQSLNPINSIIIRTSWLYSDFENNFVKTMLRLGKERDLLKVVYDQISSPTYAKDLAEVILQIIQHSIFNIEESIQIYHYSNEGICGWFDFAKEIMKIANLNCKIEPIETKEYPTPATRPFYSVLNKAKIKRDFQIDIPYWQDSLSECIKKYYKER